jgi:hypothetical protein
MLKQNYEVLITVNGKPLREYCKNNKYYVEAREGSEFQIKIKNNSFQRIVAVPSVDGLSVIDGKEASYESRGYIVDAYDTVVIDGWRESDEAVAKFVFTDKKESYSVKKGKGEENVGVIGVAIFPEKCQPDYNITFYEGEIKPQPVWYNTWGGGSTCGTFSSFSYTASTSLQGEQTRSAKQLGTGWGGAKKSEVKSVAFERADYVVEFVLNYATAEKLKEMGITLEDKPKYITPQAFPGNSYCEPPKN